MTKTTLLVRVVALLFCALLFSPVMAGVSQQEKKASSQAELIDQFGISQPNESSRTLIEKIDPRRPGYGDIKDRPAPLGAGASTHGWGVGERIDYTYNDIQRYVNQGRNVEHSYDTANGYVDVHFVYEEFSDWDAHLDTAQFAEPNKTGYNIWNANDSTWPWGQEAGCLIQGGDSVYGEQAQLDILPNGLVVIGCGDNFLAKAQAGGWYTEDDGFLIDNHFYFQETRYSCFYDTGGSGSNSTYIEESLYKPGMLAEDSAWPAVFTYAPSIAVQQVGSDTITHVVVGEWPYQSSPTGAPSETYHVIKYFRKIGSDYTGTWEEPQVIDTVPWLGYSLAASRWSAKVAVAYSNTGWYGVILDEPHDIDYFYRESTNGGVDWGSVTNITNYRRDTVSATGGIEIMCLYTSDDVLHAVFQATPTSIDPYNDGYVWGDLSMNLYHWSDAYGYILKVADANYGIEARDQVCGWGLPYAGYLAFPSISECDGNLYCVWNQIHHRVLEEGIYLGGLDCSSNPVRESRANWEIFVSVSSTVHGLLWDAPRNLTDTYTPECDSATGTGGQCGSEYKPSMEKYGLNEEGLGLKWPEEALSDPDTIAFGLDSAYDGSYFLNVMYLNDEYTGSWYYDGSYSNDIPNWSYLKWLRVACVDPVHASQIAAEPETISWTENLAWVKNGEIRYITVTVINDGNQPLDIFEIGTVETTGSDWLSTSVASLGVTAGLPNTHTFDVIVDAIDLPYGLGNATWLDGEVYLISEAGNTDSLSIPVHILAADTVPAVNWDTVATSTAWDPTKGGASAAGENIGLAVSNFGEFGLDGMNGPRQTNLDFYVDGGECRADDRSQLYAWGGSPFIMQHDGGGSNLRLTTSYGLTDQSSAYSFDPLVTSPGLTGGISTGYEYDSVYTGPFANRDTSIILERTFYAPRNNPDNPSFMVCKTVVYSGDGQAHDNVTIGSFTDWDIPSVKSPDNSVGASAPSSPAGQFVYAQGTDADTSESNLICQTNANRYGTELFLGWHTNTEYNLDVCTANTETWGSWGGRQGIAADTLIGDVIEPNVQKWYDSISVKEGVSANDSTFDQSIWVTYLFDHSIGATDTLTFYSVFSTLHDGSLNDLEANLVDARDWYLNNIRGEACAVCRATGDLNGDELLDIRDVALLIPFIYGDGDPPDPLYLADVTADCILDTLDALAIIGTLFIGGPLELPVATCCEPTIYRPGDTALAMGEAGITSAGDTMMVVDNVGTSGRDGVRIYLDDTSSSGFKGQQGNGSQGISMELSNVDLSIANSSIFFEITGEVEVTDSLPGKAVMPGTALQLVGLAGVVNNGTGALQIIGDFTPIGDPNVFMKVYQVGTQTGEATVTGGGVIAWGNDAGNGLPQVLYVSIYTASPPAVMIYLDRVTRFTLVDGPVLFGDEIHLIARNATKTVRNGRTYDVTGGYFGWFGISGFDPDVCCRGFMGNADCDIVDIVDIGDVTEMIRVLFISVGTQFCCEEEADLDYVAPIDVGDLTILINRLFISVTPPPPCP